MNISELIDLLNKNKIIIKSEGDKLLLHSINSIDDNILKLIKENKQNLLNILNANENLDIKSVELSNNGYVLSPHQDKLWVLSQYENIGSAYNMPWVFNFTGQLDTEKLIIAYHNIIRKHESLRTIFDINEHGQLCQFIIQFDSHYFPVEVINLKNKSNSSKSILSTYVNEFISIEFKLSELPLIRLRVIQLSVNEYILVFCLHHIIADGSSINILQKDLFSFYNSVSNELNHSLVSPNIITYKDYSNWLVSNLNSVEGIRSKNYWLSKLNIEIPVLEVFGSKTRPIFQTFNSGTRSIHFTKDETDKLIETTTKEKGTLYITLFSLITLVLNEFIPNEDIIIGCPVDARSNHQLESVVGYFVNVLPVQINLDGEYNFKQHYSNVREQILGAIQHQNYSINEIIDILKIKHDRSRNLLFDVVITMDVDDEHVEGNNYPFQISNYEENLNFNDSKFDLMFGFNKTKNGLDFTFKYNADIYEEYTIDSITSLLEKVFLGKINFDCKISEIQWVTKPERELLLINNQLNPDITFTSVVSIFENQVKKKPYSIALVYNGNELTYLQLNDKANSLATYLIHQKGITKGDFIGLELERTDFLIISLLAIIKAGAAYVPINKDYPEVRKDFIKKDANIKLVINDIEQKNYNNWLLENDFHYENLNLNLTKSDIIYVMYTSGSTGYPKGVLVEHVNVFRLINEPDYVELSSDDRLLQTGAIEFDASTFEIWGILGIGGQLHLLPNDLVKNPDNIKKYILEYNITIMWFTSAFFDAIVINDVSLFNGLKKILVGGSTLTSKLINKVKDNYPNLIIINGYGPTENTTFSITHLIEHIEDNIPIGKPINGTSAYILNKYNKLLPKGQVGEICLGGDGLSRGYLNSPELNKKKFFENPYQSGERLYHTGDYGRVREDGNFEFLGRIDTQVKIRGYRIELGEIENILMNHTNVFQCVVIARKITDIKEMELIAYTSGKASAKELKEYLLTRLPFFMIPTYYVQLLEIPLTNNGKVDINSLPDPKETGLFNHSYNKPKTETEIELVKIWSELFVINEKELSINTSFFDLGGHSIKAILLLGKIYKTFGVKLALKELFNNPTIEELSNFLKSSLQQEYYSSIPIVKPQDDYLVSSSQRRLWVLSKFEGANQAYNIPKISRLVGVIDEEAFTKSYQKLLERHEVLRSVFTEDKEGTPRQLILPSTDDRFSVLLIDYSNEIKEVRENLIATFVESEVNQSFNLATGPLIKCSLIKESEGNYIWILIMHHIVSDGWSMGVLHRDWSELYNSELSHKQADLPELTIQYKDYAAWHNSQLSSEEINIHKHYWLELFNGEIPVLNLPSDSSRPKVMTYNGASIYRELDKSTVDELKLFGNQQGGTLFIILQTALNILLFKYTGQEDIVIGSPIAGREHPDLEGQIGFYVNTLALRNFFSKEDSVITLYQKVKENTLRAYSHQSYPYDELVEALNLTRDLSRNPLFDVMITYQSQVEASDEFIFSNLNFLPYESMASQYEVAKFDLNFGFEEHNEGLYYSLNYNTDIYSEQQINQMLLHLEKILKTIGNHNQNSIDEYEIVTEKEKLYLTDTLNATKVDYKNDKTILDLFEQQVAKNPDAIAVKFRETELTYKELNEKSNQLAHYLISKYNIKSDELIGIKLDISLEQVIGVLGVLKSGAAYVPIDKNYPNDRILFIEKDSGIKLLFDEDQWNQFYLMITLYPTQSPIIKITSSSSMYVIYTSGSTGVPKGCVLNYEGVINYLEWIKEYGRELEYTEVDFFSSLSFDFTVTSLFGALTEGKTLRVYDNQEDLGIQLNKIVLNPNSGWIKLTPAHINLIEETTLKKARSKVFVLGGEALLPEQIKHLRHNPGCRIYNEYGPTEATVGCIVKEVSEKNEPYIGQPIPNTEVYLLDNSLNLVPYGCIGEICIGGVGLAREYLNRPELTKEKFIDNPHKPGERIYRTGDLGRWRETGDIEYFGRIDDQVKIRGYRIELGEIEQTLSSHPNSGQVVVIAKSLNKTSDKDIIAYTTGEALAEDLKIFLKDKLPHYMVPNYYVKLSEIPLTNNGKVDKKALIDPEGTGLQKAEYVAPRTEIEKQLVEIWSEVLILDIHSISINSDFFSIGGNSLKAIRLITRIHRILEIRLIISDLILNNDVESLAIMIESLRETGTSKFEIEL